MWGHFSDLDLAKNQEARRHLILVHLGHFVGSIFARIDPISDYFRTIWGNFGDLDLCKSQEARRWGISGGGEGSGVPPPIQY